MGEERIFKLEERLSGHGLRQKRRGQKIERELLEVEKQRVNEMHFMGQTSGEISTKYSKFSIQNNYLLPS
jgi:hypothetical protein